VSRHQPIVAYDLCDHCGKYTYESRKHARAHARKMSRTGLNAYRCPINPQWWHLGHLPDSAKAGRVSREEVASWGRSR
jgi:hypothetical protein